MIKLNDDDCRMFSGNRMDNNNDVSDDGVVRIAPPEEFQDPEELHARIRTSIKSLERISTFLDIILKSANCKLPHCLTSL